MARRDPARRGGINLVALAAAVLGGVLLFRPRAAAQTDVTDSGRGSPSKPPSAQSVRRGFETSDMNAGTVTKVLLTCFSIAVVAVGGLFVMIDYWHRSDIPPSITAQQSAQIQPPGPNLQSDPYRDLANLRARERERVESYGWSDDAHTRARIPIERAMSLVTGRSLEPAP